MNAGCAGKTEIHRECVPYLSALEVCSRRGAIQIHVYLTYHNAMSYGTLCQQYAYKTSRLAISSGTEPNDLTLCRGNTFGYGHIILQKRRLRFSLLQTNGPYKSPKHSWM